MIEYGFSRRQLLQCVAAGTASAIAGAQGAAAQVKSPQQTAGYQATPNGSQRCGNCAHFQPPAACKVVAGKISPQGWCRIYFAKAG
jgi:hypothetical protein